MKNSVSKIILIVALCLVGVGVAVFGIGVALGGKPSFAVNYDNHTTSTNASFNKAQEQVSAFKSLKIDVSAADVTVAYGDDYGISYGFYDDQKLKMETQDDNFVVTSKNEDGFFGVGFLWQESQYVKITVPQDTKLEDVYIHTSAGDIQLSEVTCKKLDAKSSAGDITLTDNRIESGKITSSAGDIEFTDLDTDDLEIHASAGNAEGSLAQPLDSYNLDLKTSAGEITVDHKEHGNKYTTTADGNKTLKVKLSAGDVDLEGK